VKNFTHLVSRKYRVGNPKHKVLIDLLHDCATSAEHQKNRAATEQGSGRIPVPGEGFAKEQATYDECPEYAGLAKCGDVTDCGVIRTLHLDRVVKLRDVLDSALQELDNRDACLPLVFTRQR
jgi:hypothetical protein